MLIHAHGIALHTIGIVGRALIGAEAKRWKDRLKALAKVDWSRSNTKLWEGRTMVGGRVSKARIHVILTAAALKRALDLQLSPEEERIDAQFRKRGG